MSKSERLKISGPPARSSSRRIEPLLRVCICGGGNLGHAFAGIIGSNPAVEVRVLTRRPDEWGSIIKVYWGENHVCLGRISAVSSNARSVVSGSDVVLLALPAFARRSVLEQVRPYVGPSTWIGSIPGTEGFDWLADEVLGPKHKVFGTQRAPYVCHTVKYGQSARLSGVRPRLSVGAHPIGDLAEIAGCLESMLGIPTERLPNYLAVSLTPANALIHPARVFSLFRDWKKGVTYARKITFYPEWDSFATEVYLACGDEVQAIIGKLPLDISSVKPILEQYKATSAEEITRQIRSSAALTKIQTPLIRRGNKYQPDFEHRFFTEDISHGLVSLRSIADLASVSTPMIDEILFWAEKPMRRKFLAGPGLRSEGNEDLPLATNFGIKDKAGLVRRALC